MSRQHSDLEQPVGGDADDEGRDEARAAGMQARMFAGLAVFSVVAGIGYGLLSGEPAGTTLLILTGGLTGLCGLYINWNRRPSVTTPGADGTGHEVEEQWFPHASPWPFAIAVSIVVTANAALLGLWLLLPAGALLAASVAGFAAQSRHRN